MYGVDCSELAIKQFFTENKIDYDVSKYSNLNEKDTDDKIFQVISYLNIFFIIILLFYYIFYNLFFF